MALVKSVALKALATATGQQWATKTLDTAFLQPFTSAHNAA
jgi:hypothetical protein